MAPETETIESTTETVTETEYTDEGATTTETVTSTSEYPVSAGPRHCDCAECQEYEEDIAHELATLRNRLDDLTEGTEELTEGTRHEAAPEPKEKETVVETTPEVKAESKSDDKPSKPKRKPAGWFV